MPADATQVPRSSGDLDGRVPAFLHLPVIAADQTDSEHTPTETLLPQSLLRRSPTKANAKTEPAFWYLGRVRKALVPLCWIFGCGCWWCGGEVMVMTGELGRPGS